MTVDTFHRLEDTKHWTLPSTEEITQFRSPRDRVVYYKPEPTLVGRWGIRGESRADIEGHCGDMVTAFTGKIVSICEKVNIAFGIHYDRVFGLLYVVFRSPLESTPTTQKCYRLSVEGDLNTGETLFGPIPLHRIAATVYRRFIEDALREGFDKYLIWERERK